MSANTDYLDRLKTIREKYGCSQPKNQPISYSDTLTIDRPTAIDRQLPYERPTTSNYYKPDTYALERMKILDAHIPAPATTLVSNPKTTDYSLRPQSSMGHGGQSYQGLGEFPRKADREREIEQIKQSYAASRRKVIEQISSKNYSRDYAKQTTIDYLKGEKDYLRDYTRQVRDQPKTQFPIASTKIDLLSRAEQSVSPIKRMSDYEEKKSYRAREVDTPDTFWKQRQAKLSELAVNRLNENPRSSLLKDQKYGVKRSGLYDQPKNYQQSTLARREAENRADGYSVNNIDRIQQRIQSILAKK